MPYPGAQKSAFSAATSHDDNDTYMQQFEQVLHRLSAMGAPGGGGQLEAQAPSAGSSPKGARAGALQGLQLLLPQLQQLQLQLRRATAAHHGAEGRARPGPAPELTEAAPPVPHADTMAGWRRGPKDEAGLRAEVAERPLLCGAARWSAAEVVLGGADHALHVLDVRSGRRRRTLYSRSVGHTEWVSCVAYLPDGRILSGGMDSALWLWGTSGISGCEARGHTAPVSQVRACSGAAAAASSSYDKTVALWDVGGARPRVTRVLAGHGAPVMELDCSAPGLALSGDRRGGLILWDLERGELTWRAPAAHEGHVTALGWLQGSAAGSGGGGAGSTGGLGGDGGGSSGVFVSGGQDGRVTAWDVRSGRCVAEAAAHKGPVGRGAVGGLAATGSRGIASIGADKTLRLLDPGQGLAMVGAAPLTDFPYSLALVPGTDLALAGCGDGSVHVVDLGGGVRTLYALGAGRAAVRVLLASAERLTCAGDDGAAMSYLFAR